MVNESAYESGGYFETRFAYDESMEVLWDVVSGYLDRQYGIKGTVVDVGAGYGYFLNGIDVDHKIAIDHSRHPLTRTKPDIGALIGDASDVPLANNAVDIVMASNVLEHLEMEGIQAALTEFRRILQPDGTLYVITPNFSLAPRQYFDDFTHESVLTHRSVGDLIGLAGFDVRDSVIRFLPFSSHGRLPIVRSLVKLYLRLPISPFAGQSLFVATPH